jgi:sigma-54 dependent transcriptional regulator, acetoin dehydrogenase operon transcriptional activator AcoR
MTNQDTRMNNAADRRLEIAAARADFLNTGTRTSTVPDIVAASWQRSAAAGVSHEDFVLPYYNDLDIASRLVRCAEPVIHRLTEETHDLPLSIALTDSKARVLSRTDTARTIGILLEKVSLTSGFGWDEGDAGTNGIGTVLESGSSVYIVGPEHFNDAVQPFACAGAPVRDPITGRVEGILDISCLAEHSTPLLHSLVRSAAAEIERGLMLDHSQAQQGLFDAYIRVDARSNKAVLAVGANMVMANAKAQQLLDSTDQLMLQDHARFILTHRDEFRDQIVLAGGECVHIHATRITVGTEAVGVILVITPAQNDRPGRWMPATPPATRHPSPERPQLADTPVYDSLTPAWRAAAADINAAFQRGDRVLIMGEAGSGKATLATEVHASLHGPGHRLMVEASTVSHESITEIDQWLESVTDPTLCIVHLGDDVDDRQAADLRTALALIGQSGKAVTVVVTLSQTRLPTEVPFAAVLADFQATVTVPPLRHRAADIPAIVTRILRELAPHRDITVSPQGMRLLARYTWPGNIRQLRDALRETLEHKPVGTITERDFPGYCSTTSRRSLTQIEEAERDTILAALRDNQGNRLRAAQSLGLARSSLYRKLKQYGLTAV